MEEAKTIQIKKACSGEVVYQHTCIGNTLKATVSKAVEQGVPLYGANLYGADLYGADLSDADLRGADLYGADLYGADLYGADLRGADLSDADLRGADLSDADLRGCIIYCNDEDSAIPHLAKMVEKFSSEYRIKITEAHENHDSRSWRNGPFWRNLLIIRKWELEGTFELTKSEKNAIRAFAEMCGANDHVFSNIDNQSILCPAGVDPTSGLKMPRPLSGLEHGRTYSVASLVGDEEEQNESI